MAVVPAPDAPAHPIPTSPTVDPAFTESIKPARPHGPVKDTVAGATPYDIGVTVDRRVIHTPDGRHIFNESVAISRQLHDRESSELDDLTHLNEILHFYRMVFKENPVAADNQSVMAALMGDNPRKIVVFPPDHPALNESGALVDRWGTPYHFHALSGREMEIVSPGPDRRLGSNDDVIFTERDEGDFFRGITAKADLDLNE